MNAPCKPGDRIRLIQMGPDPDPIPSGTTGTVRRVVGPLGPVCESDYHIEVDWDIPRSLALETPVDTFEVI